MISYEKYSTLNLYIYINQKYANLQLFIEITAGSTSIRVVAALFSSTRI